MTGALAWVLVGLGLGVVVVRRRSIAIGLVTTQALILAVLALTRAETASNVVAAAALAVRAVAFGALLLFALARSREAQPVRARLSPTARLALAVLVIVLVTALVPVYGLSSHQANQAVLALLAAGLTCAATRRATLFHVLAIVLVENGLALAAVETPRGSSLIIELGVTLDLTLIVCVAAVFHLRIFTEFGAGDSAALRSLRD
jgi:hydrogenase-4 membrane subunit HyfE